MPDFLKKHLRTILNQSVVGCLFLLGLLLVVIKPMGFHLSLIPGDLGDVRFNNYILEHFFRWVSGLDKSYWSPAIFFPFPDTVAFSDNLLGSAPFYAFFRWLGLNRETAYQAWYILGFVLNYYTVATVLSRFRLNGLAVAAGAFYFAFGLPVLAQENHPQLLYRFAIPLACFFLWQFARRPRLGWLAALTGMAVWQFYLGVYNGVFLIFLLFGMILLTPFCFPSRSLWERLKFWPRQWQQAWSGSTSLGRLLTLLVLFGLGASLGVLFWPYYQTSRLYGFSRSWDEVSSMLPRWQSYFLEDNAFGWKTISAAIPDIPVRHEHQLFPGLVALAALFLVVWVLRKLEPGQKGFVLVHLGALGLLVALTLDLGGFSLYRQVWDLSGINSIRAVTRIILVMMWPLAVLVAFGVHALMRSSPRAAPVMVPIAFLLTGILIFESASYTHLLFGKRETQTRLAELRKAIPAQIPPDPVLIVASRVGNRWWAIEIDAMLLSQDLGWPVFNGYSGNHPPNYGPTETCAQLPQRILAYMEFAHLTSPDDYLGLINRAVPLGFYDCDPAWWKKMPTTSPVEGALALESFQGVQLKVESLKQINEGIRARVTISIPSGLLLPARPSSQNPVGLAWRLVNLDQNKPLPGFNGRKNLDFDVPANDQALITWILKPPPEAGHYRLEVTLVQEGIGWFQDYGMKTARSEQILSLDASQQIQITPATLP